MIIYEVYFKTKNNIEAFAKVFAYNKKQAKELTKKTVNDIKKVLKIVYVEKDDTKEARVYALFDDNNKIKIND